MGFSKEQLTPYKTCAYPRLKAALQVSGLSIPALCERMDRSPTCLWWWLTGRNEYALDTIRALLDASGLTFEEAFGECEGRR